MDDREHSLERPTTDEDVERSLKEAADAAQRRHEDEEERRRQREAAERAGENPRRQ